ncbi:MAG: hypothetical protein OJF58_000175 [Enhydrobacter sp.]|nr:MAG: hypothetical protein OJF58_000175 [Enhydrobacter sp.]
MTDDPHERHWSGALRRALCGACHQREARHSLQPLPCHPERSEESFVVAAKDPSLRSG